MAWHPAQKWVFRGGFALNTVDVKFPASRGQFEEYVADANQQRAARRSDGRFTASAEGPIRLCTPSGRMGLRHSSARTSARAVQNGGIPNLRNPYVLNWNFSVQHELTQNYLLEFSYQASSGVGLVERWQTNTFPIDFGTGNLAFQNTVLAAAQNLPALYRILEMSGCARTSGTPRSTQVLSNWRSGTLWPDVHYVLHLV